MLPPRLISLDGNRPADPLVARERRYVFPGRQCPRVGGERLSEVRRKIMYDSSGDSDGCHRAISQAKRSGMKAIKPSSERPIRYCPNFESGSRIRESLWKAPEIASAGLGMEAMQEA